jgi:hypothetical protein
MFVKLWIARVIARRESLLPEGTMVAGEHAWEAAKTAVQRAFGLRAELRADFSHWARDSGTATGKVMRGDVVMAKICDVSVELLPRARGARK